MRCGSGRLGCGNALLRPRAGPWLAAGSLVLVEAAHGVPKSVPAAARARNLNFLDATCPLVTKVHVQAERQFEQGKEIILIGHAGHPEVVGTMGQLPDGAITLIESVADAESYQPRDPGNLAYCTQTTLSLDDTAQIIAVLQRRFPQIAAPYKEDICYATTNRQDAVKAIAPQCDLVLVLGAPNSSNSVRLVEVAKRNGAKNAQLVESAADVDWAWFDGVTTLGVSAGASAPEDLVETLIDAVRRKFAVTLESVETTRENVTFRLPRALLPG